MKTTILSLLLLILYNTIGYTQIDTRYSNFTRIYSGKGSTIGKGVCIDTKGRIYVAGIQSDVISNTSTNAFLIQLDSTALHVNWRIALVGNGIDEFTAVRYSATDSTIVVCGFTNSNTVNNNYQGIVHKYSTNGTLLWNKTIGGIDVDIFNDCTINTNGDIYCVGTTTSNTNAGSDVWLVKLNTQGTELANKTIGNAFDDKGNGISVQHDTLFAVGTTSNSANEFNYYLLALNATCDTLYTATWGTDTVHEVLLKCTARNNAIHLTGTRIFNGDKNPYLALHNTANANKLWEYNFLTNPTSNDEGICTVYFPFNNLWAQVLNTNTYSYLGTIDLFIEVAQSNGNIINGPATGYKYDDVYYNACWANDSCLIAVGTSDSYLKNGYTNLIIHKQNIYKPGTETADSVNAVKPVILSDWGISTYVTHNELTITSTQNNLVQAATLTVINTLGQQLEIPVLKGDSRTCTYNTSALNNGVYYARIVFTNGLEHSVKFIIQ
jgi:hypothetical protein